MIQLAVTAAFRLRNLLKLRKMLKETGGVVASAERELSDIYTQFVLKRFDRLSKSGGGSDWPDISEVTKLAKKSSAILVDTRIMRLGIAQGITSHKTVGARGASMRFAVTTTAAHPKAKMPIKDLAAIHQLGLGRVKQRKIVVAPDTATKKRMATSVIRHLKKEVAL